MFHVGCLSCIFEQLSVRDRLGCRLVCHAWNKAASSNYVWRNVHFAGFHSALQSIGLVRDLGEFCLENPQVLEFIGKAWCHTFGQDPAHLQLDVPAKKRQRVVYSRGVVLYRTLLSLLHESTPVITITTQKQVRVAHITDVREMILCYLDYLHSLGDRNPHKR